MRAMSSCVICVILMACDPPVPDDTSAGVGFGDYDSYLEQRRARERELSGINAPAVTTPQTGASDAQQVAAAAVAAIGRTGADAMVSAPRNPGISDEQDFNAVSQRQSIASDAARRQRQQGQFEAVAPTAVPERPGATTPTPIEFALQVSHPVGQKMYRRSPFGRAQVAANCARYASSDIAQDVFLKAGGPARDRLKLDPDGDGYACGWNPAKYRAIVRG